MKKKWLFSVLLGSFTLLSAVMGYEIFLKNPDAIFKNPKLMLLAFAYIGSMGLAFGASLTFIFSRHFRPVKV